MPEIRNSKLSAWARPILLSLILFLLKAREKSFVLIGNERFGLFWDGEVFMEFDRKSFLRAFFVCWGIIIVSGPGGRRM